MIEGIEKKLQIAKADMIGIIVTVNWFADPFYGYTHTPEGTHVRLLRTSTGWALIDAYRANCQGGKHYYCNLTDRAKEAIIRRHEIFDY